MLIYFLLCHSALRQTKTTMVVSTNYAFYSGYVSCAIIKYRYVNQQSLTIQIESVSLCAGVT